MSMIRAVAETPGRLSYDLNGNLTGSEVDCLGDANGDHVVDSADLAIISAAYGYAYPDPEYDPRADFDGDGDVDEDDVMVWVNNANAACAYFAFAYDYRNRLVDIEVRHETQQALDPPPPPMHRYGYDAFGRRVKKTTDVGTGEERTVYFIYGGGPGGGGWQLLEEWEDVPLEVPALNAMFVHSGLYVDDVVQMRRWNEIEEAFEDFYYHCDDLSSVRALTDDEGELVELYDYHEFGLPTITDPNTIVNGRPALLGSSAFGNPFLFTGQTYDPETRLYHYRTRQFEPRMGRFISVDSIGVWGDGANLGNGYAYVGNMPGEYVDPWGEAPGWTRRGYPEFRWSEFPFNPIRNPIPNSPFFYSPDDIPGMGLVPGGRRFESWEDLWRQIEGLPPDPNRICVLSCHGSDEGPYFDDSSGNQTLSGCPLSPRQKELLKSRCGGGFWILACGGDDPNTEKNWQRVADMWGVPIRRSNNNFGGWVTYPGWHNPKNFRTYRPNSPRPNVRSRPPIRPSRAIHYGCFVADTPVLVGSNGEFRNIENLRVGDMVASSGTDGEPCVLTPIIRIYFTTLRAGLIELVFEDECPIQTTEKHPFLLESGDWIEAGSLREGDQCVTATGSLTRLLRFKYIPLERPTLVYNLHVSGSHTYYVGCSGILVHNK